MQFQFSPVLSNDMSEDSSTIVSSMDELFHEFLDINCVHDVFMHMTYGKAIKSLLAAG
jgi:hypothetical protein